MTLLNPTALILGALALPILLLYMLKLRRRRVEISSILLWQMLLRDRQANTPWQRLRRNLLLFLQLLILACLVLALSRPAIPSASIASGSLVVLMDGSASMTALEGSSTRFEASRVAVRELIRDLGSDEMMTLILVRAQPVVLAASQVDKHRLYDALDQAEPAQGPANWEAALALAAGAASQTSSNNTILIVSDGGIPQANLPGLPGDVRYLPIGATGENLALTALALRPAGGSAELFASVKNYGQHEQQALLSIYANDDLLEAQSLTIPAGAEKSLTLSGLPDTQAVYFARLTPVQQAQPDASAEQFNDALELDNTAYAVYQPPRAGRLLLVSPGNIFLEQVLAALPSITPYQYVAQDESAIQLPEDSFDCYVFDGVLPESLPAGNFLLINPPSNELFAVTGSFAPHQPAYLPSHPLTAQLDWSNVHIAQAGTLQAPAWAETLVEVDGKPIVFVGETAGHRLAVLMFDLHQSDLPLQVAFPILIANLIDYLVPSYGFPAQNAILPGDTLLIRSQPSVDQVVVVSPSGKTFTYPASSSGILFADTHELGLYAVNYLQEGAQSAEYFAVNLFDPLESDIQPRASLTVGRMTIQASAADRLSLRELWPWISALALFILLIEWWVYHRYTHVGQTL